MQNSIKKIAFLRLSSLGDIIVGACVLDFVREALKAMYPQGVEMHWIVDSAFGEVLRDSPCIDKLIEIPLKNGGLGKIAQIYRILRSLDMYDVLIDMQGLLKSSICGAVMRKKDYWGFGWDSIKEPLASVCYTQRAHIPYNEHILRRNATLVCEALGFEMFKTYNEEMIYKNRANAFGISKKAQIECENILSESRKFKNSILVLLVLEASLESKTYPLDLFIELIDKMLLDNTHIDILLLQHSTDKAQRIKQHFLHNDNVIMLPRMCLGTLKAIVNEIDVVIGGDTGVTHLAWAMERASITLYGNTPPSRFALHSVYNHFLSGSENPSYQKDDFSIANIAPRDIYAKVIEIVKMLKNRDMRKDIANNQGQDAH